VLTLRDIDNVNLSCNFFRTILMKYPPEEWCVSVVFRCVVLRFHLILNVCRRVLSLTSLVRVLFIKNLNKLFILLQEHRTAKDMTGFVAWQRMRSICRLEGGF
jgi:hypothetical protein